MSHPTPSSPRASFRAGFTLIELMVVIAIIVMAAGVIIPSMADFFGNRELDGARTKFTATLNSARLQAVAKSRPFIIVFFKEGVRTYDVTRRTWRADEDFDPRSGIFASEKLHFDLVFANAHNRCARSEGGRDCAALLEHDACKLGSPCAVDDDLLPRFDDWWWLVTHGKITGVQEVVPEGSQGPAGNPPGGGPAPPPTLTFPVDDLIGIRFSRDGTLESITPASIYVYDPSVQRGADPLEDGYEPPISKRTRTRTGSDVPAGKYRADDDADILVWMRGGDDACFIDLQATGAVASKISAGAQIRERNVSR